MKEIAVSLEKYENFKNMVFSKEIRNTNSFIHGAVGIGKSELVKFIIGTSKSVWGKSVEYVNMQKYISAIQESWKEGITSKLKINFNADVFVVDDLGAEFIHPTTLPYIYEFFEKRFDIFQNNPDKQNILVSNYPFDQLMNKYNKIGFSNQTDKLTGERIESRISGLLELDVFCKGTDKRKNFKETIEVLNNVRLLKQQQYLVEYEKKLKPKLIELFKNVNLYKQHQKGYTDKNEFFVKSEEFNKYNSLILKAYFSFGVLLEKYSFQLQQLHKSNKWLFESLIDIAWTDKLMVNKEQFGFDKLSKMHYFLWLIEEEIKATFADEERSYEFW